MTNQIQEHPNALAAFFKEPESQMGAFYPTHYIVATFAAYDVALKANFALRGAGFGENEVLPVSGGDALDFFQQFRDHAGVWGNLMIEFSRFIDTEAALADKDIARAKRGAGFLVVHALTEPEAYRIREMLAPFSPVAMHWYLPGSIQSLV